MYILFLTVCTIWTPSRQLANSSEAGSDKYALSCSPYVQHRLDFHVSYSPYVQHRVDFGEQSKVGNGSRYTRSFKAICTTQVVG